METSKKKTCQREQSPERVKKRKKSSGGKKIKRKRRSSSPSSSSSSTRSPSSSPSRKKHKKHKRRNEKKRSHEKLQKTEMSFGSEVGSSLMRSGRPPGAQESSSSASAKNRASLNTALAGPSSNLSVRKGPMTKEEWDKRQNVIQRVYDEETGRSRLVKGEGEIIEEIVSLQKHKEINKIATFGDGVSFSKLTGTFR